MPEDFDLAQIIFDNLLYASQHGMGAFAKKVGTDSATKFVELIKGTFSSGAGAEALKDLEQAPNDGDLHGQLAYQIKKALAHDPEFASKIRECLLNSELPRDAFSTSKSNNHISNSGLIIENFQASHNLLEGGSKIFHVEQVTKKNQEEKSAGEHNNENFLSRRIVLDGGKFDGCEFKECEIVYLGGELPSLFGCGFINCKWILEGAADRTVSFMRTMYQAGGLFRSMIEATLGIDKNRDT